MKKSRFNEEQIIAIIRGEDGGRLPQARRERGDVLCLEEEVRWDGRGRGATAQGT